MLLRAKIFCQGMIFSAMEIRNTRFKSVSLFLKSHSESPDKILKIHWPQQGFLDQFL